MSFASAERRSTGFTPEAGSDRRDAGNQRRANQKYSKNRNKIYSGVHLQ